MRVYDPKQCAVTFANVQLTGWADGDFITIANASDAFTAQVGTDGEVTRSRTNNNMATITIRTMQSSPVNDLLSALHRMDLLLPNGAGVAPFQLQDLNGTSDYFAEHAWIVKAPDAKFGREAAEREWTLTAAEIDRRDGSNLQPPPFGQ
jgi:hypothetical protein